MLNVTVPPPAEVPRAVVPPGEVVHTLTRDDLVAFTHYLWRHEPRRLPGRVRGALWVFAIEFFVWFPFLIVAAAGGIAVAVYFVARAVCSPHARAAGVPGNVLWGYIIPVGLALLVGFRRGGFLWRWLGLGFRKFMTKVAWKHGQKAAGQETFDETWTYRLSLTAAGFTRVIDRLENRGGVESCLRRTETAPWSVVAEVAATDEHAFLLIAGADLAFIVPARAFAGAAAFAAFVAEARRRRQLALSPQGSPVEGSDGRQTDATQGGSAARRDGITVIVENVTDRGRIGSRGF